MVQVKEVVSVVLGKNIGLMDLENLGRVIVLKKVVQLHQS
nr:Putative uncharacterized protein [Moritella viscosa]SHO17824.1 Putative uncharacterized protein [Moritella viscosa]SHO19079.1 Putative uncharacterized protein [Moritella viscosa]